MIKSLRVYGPSGEFGEVEQYTVGAHISKELVVTDIKQRDTSPEPYCTLSFIEVWCGENLYAEFNKARIVGIYYS